MVIQKIFVNDNKEATVTCPGCGRRKVTDATPFMNRVGPIKVRCGCGHEFGFTVEKRKQYRKSVNLTGQYSRAEPLQETGEMDVEDLSRTGLSFRTSKKNTLQVEDIIKVKFTLDDADRTLVTKNVVVRRVEGRSIGAEFCDNLVDKRLAFYLMP